MIIVAGLANVFVQAKYFIMHARSRMVATELGKYFLDPLYQNVRMDQWLPSANCLTGNTSGCPANQTINNIQYSGTYDITATGNTSAPYSPLGSLRRVVLNVTWTEINP